MKEKRVRREDRLKPRGFSGHPAGVFGPSLIGRHRRLIVPSAAKGKLPVFLRFCALDARMMPPDDARRRSFSGDIETAQHPVSIFIEPCFGPSLWPARICKIKIVIAVVIHPRSTRSSNCRVV